MSDKKEVKEVEEVYIAILEDNEGMEQIPAIIINGATIPFVASSRIDKASMLQIVQKFVNTQGKPLKIYKYKTRELEEVLQPDPNGPKLPMAPDMEDDEDDVIRPTSPRVLHIPGSPKCPICKFALDGTAEISGNKNQPVHGDCVVCFGCLAFLSFVLKPTGDFELKVLSQEEFLKLPEGTRKQIESFRTTIMQMRMRSLSGLGTPKDD